MCGDMMSYAESFLLASRSYCFYSFFSLKLNEIIGGSCSGSPTAISLRQLNREIGKRL